MMSLLENMKYERETENKNKNKLDLTRRICKEHWGDLEAISLRSMLNQTMVSRFMSKAM